MRMTAFYFCTQGHFDDESGKPLDRVHGGVRRLHRMTLALLTPVPLEHLLDGEAVAASEGRVAFGSQAIVIQRAGTERRKASMA